MAGAGDSKFGKKQEGAEFFLLKLFVALKIRKMCNLEGNVALFDAPKLWHYLQFGGKKNREIDLFLSVVDQTKVRFGIQFSSVRQFQEKLNLISTR